MRCLETSSALLLDLYSSSEALYEKNKYYPRQVSVISKTPDSLGLLSFQASEIVTSYTPKLTGYADPAGASRKMEKLG